MARRRRLRELRELRGLRRENPDPPKSFPARVFTGAIVVGIGVAAGAYAGRVAQGPAGAISQGAGASIGGLLGGMLASFGALAYGAYQPAWRDTGEMAALLGLGGVTAMATVSAFRPGGVFAPPVTSSQISSDAANDTSATPALPSTSATTTSSDGSSTTVTSAPSS